MSTSPHPTEPPVASSAPAASPAADGHSPAGSTTVAPGHPAAPAIRSPREVTRQKIIRVAAALAVLVMLWFGVPVLIRALTTVSTDDAYVNGHVTFIAARVPGQVTRVLVDDNYRVKQGGLAGRARQGAVPDSGRVEKGGGRHGQGQRGGGRRPGARHRGPSSQQSLPARARHGGRAGSAGAAEVAGCAARRGKGQPGAGRTAILPAANRWSAREPSANNNTTTTRPRSTWPRIA